MLRTFAGLPLSAEVGENLRRLQERLRRTRCRVGWVRPENLHVTLAFLGDVDEAGRNGAAEAMDAVARDAAPFRCEVGGVGCFGRPRAPRVVWAGVMDGAELVSALQGRLAAALAERGHVLEERPYVPHVTLGRVRSAAGAGELAREVEAVAQCGFGGFEVGALRLFTSRLGPSGPEYALIHEAPLGGRLDPAEPRRGEGP